MDGFWQKKTREQIVADEMARIKRNVADEAGTPRPLAGLALSGGGIRSASFSLGVAQALEEHGVLDRMDYLSTVSGGGYTGAAITWLRRADWSPDGLGRLLHKALRPEGRDRAITRPTFALVLERFADFLRSRGNYLDPNRRLNALSLVGVVLRTMVIHLSVYGSAATLALFLLHLPEFPVFKVAGAAAVILLAVLAVWSLGYAVSTGRGGGVQPQPDDGTWLPCDKTPDPARESAVRRYLARTRFQIYSGRALGIALLLALVASLPLAEDLFRDAWDKAWAQGAAGFIGLVAGGAQALAQFLKGQQGREQGGILTSAAAIWATAFAALYGLLLAADYAATSLAAAPVTVQVGMIGALAVLVGVVGWLANINLVTPHRMYRDRLMEAFMPNPADMLGKTSNPATCADRSQLTVMCDGVAPLHLVNTNLVLVDSPNTLYRGRGGDNFVLSPVLCGGDATGWAAAKDFAGTHADGLTLATAMAISGAAVNAHCGVGGQGAMRNGLVSMLLSLFGLQLGYWVSRGGCAAGSPNFYRPGFDALLGQGFDEGAAFLQLSDGGHFENLALYELVRRQVDTIVVVDGGADAEFQFGDLGNAIERVYADFGAVISFGGDLGAVVPETGTGYPERLGLAKTGWVKGSVAYADGGVADLYYVKATLVAGLPESIFAYKGANPDFPHQSTADQFFDENQLEAYRRLGCELTRDLAGILAQTLGHAGAPPGA